MKKPRDFSMLYAVLAGFVLFLAVWLLMTSGPPIVSLPAGSRTSTIDTFGGFPAYGIELDIVSIPEAETKAFIRQLQEKEFQELPLPEDLWYTLHLDPDTQFLADVSNGLWRFENRDSHDDDGGMLNGIYTHFTLLLYDKDSHTYYDLLYVF